MTTQESKTVDAKKEHGELMVAVATSIFIGIFSIFLDPDTLEVFQSTDNLTLVGYIILWGVMGTVAICLMNGGLTRIYRARSNREPLQSLTIPSIEKTPDSSGGLNIAINHYNTQITIRIEQGKIK